MLEIIEYYKYHSEIPRFFMSPLNKLLNYFFNNKRRIKFQELMGLLDISEKTFSSKDFNEKSHAFKMFKYLILYFKY